MLTLNKAGKRTKSIAFVRGGEYDGDVININPDLTSMNPALMEDYSEFEQEQGYQPVVPSNDFEYQVMKKTNGKKISLKEYKEIKKKTAEENKSIIGPRLVLNPMDNSRIYLLLSVTTNDVISIFGKKGSGKSTFANDIANIYRELFPNNEIYLFSRILEDKSIEAKKLNITRLPIDINLLDMDINFDDFRPSLVIFDDIDGLQTLYDEKGKKGQKLGQRLYSKINQLQNDLIRLGRDHDGKGDIHNVHIRHMLYEHGGKTKMMLNGSTCVIIFPNGIDHAHLEKFFRERSIDKMMKEKLRNVRWFGYCNHPNVPTFVFGEKFIYIL